MLLPTYWYKVKFWSNSKSTTHILYIQKYYVYITIKMKLLGKLEHIQRERLTLNLGGVNVFLEGSCHGVPFCSTIMRSRSVWFVIRHHGDTSTSTVLNPGQYSDRLRWTSRLGWDTIMSKSSGSVPFEPGEGVSGGVWTFPEWSL